MCLVSQISTGLMLVELFYLLNPTYHPDYYDELKNNVRSIECLNPNISSRQFCLELMSHYLYSSNNRFKFAKKFVTFCKELSI